ncbi:hypothetical protein A5634_11510 [Mycobacterium asiaticum]|uniref:Iron transporter n=1 Tax=Mycobacterium asiaticum TaxID=1790 RepID=A0A1A3NKC3_MYCAS|nr:FTR1 family protein [Mycobacterium asiaticum]OBK20807.1 hypothetical protein A5634_11510 [Mycobacterium asiaticum]
MQGVYGAFVAIFLVGLREGLEVTLLVSIAAAFLKRSGVSVRPMFAAIGVAVAISIGIGVGLNLLSTSLPAAQQEMMATVVGVIAVAFMTSMIIWMTRNAGRLQGEVEDEARQAIIQGGSAGLVLMAFLAVLKEGFELSVFMLAAADTAHDNRWVAVLGGAVGIAVSIAMGVGLYFGGMKLDLQRFFRVTGVFLVLIAAGLLLNTLRSAYEAGWLTIAQQQLFDLSSWIPESSIQGAVVTGLFGIPADPRLIEVLGWLLYVVPVLAVLFLPARRRTTAPAMAGG